MAAWQKKKPKRNDSLCNYTVKKPQTHYVAEIVQNTHECIKTAIKKILLIKNTRRTDYKLID